MGDSVVLVVSFTLLGVRVSSHSLRVVESRENYTWMVASANTCENHATKLRETKCRSTTRLVTRAMESKYGASLRVLKPTSAVKAKAMNLAEVRSVSKRVIIDRS